MVVSQDGEPTPKVIDFGIAKTTQEPLIDDPVVTAQQAFLGTPAYSSPERLEGRAKGADPRADIFSLGALLYELICGQLPKAPNSETAAEPKEGKTEGPANSEVAPISQRFASLPERERSHIAKSLGLSPSRVQSLLKGELGAIAMKCLERDPERRYPSVADLLADLDAHLQGKPVAAQPRGSYHRASKLWQGMRKPIALWIEAAALLAICSAMFLHAYNSFDSRDATTYPTPVSDKSVAILPLQDLGPDPELAYFTEGIHGDLINRVSTIEELRTISHLAVLSYWKARWLRQVYALEPESHLNALRVSWAYGDLLDKENAAIWAQRFLDLTADSENLGIQIYRQILQERWDEADQLFWDNDSLDRDFYMNCSIAGMIKRDLGQGKPQAALRRYLKAKPELAGERLDRGEFHPFDSLGMAKALIAAGEVARGTRILEHVVERLLDPSAPRNKYRTTYLLRSHLVLGNVEAAQQLARKDPFIFVKDWRIDEELSPLFQDAELERLMLETEGVLAEQRTRVAQWKDEGKLAAMPPLPGTPPQLAEASDVAPLPIP